jgi:ribosomal protein S18 acetylase RimI-like enzyme
MTTTNSDVRVRAVRGDELDAFAASDDPRQAAWLRSYLAERIPAGTGRPEWCFVAERGGRTAGRLTYRSPHPVGAHRAVDILDLPWDGDWLGVGGPLLRQSLAALRAQGATTVDCAVDTPSGWDPFRAQILRLLARCGFALRRETHRFEWRPPARARPGEPVSPPPGRLMYRPLEEAGEAAFVAAIGTVMTGTLDRGHRQDLRREGPARKARGYFDAARRLAAGGGWRAGPGWWQLAETPTGAFVGLLMPMINAAGTGIVWYLGVAPEQRGRRYVDDLLARLTGVLAAAGVARIVADADTENAPMAAAFRRAGWVEFARSASYVLDLAGADEAGA